MSASAQANYIVGYQKNWSWSRFSVVIFMRTKPRPGNNPPAPPPFSRKNCQMLRRTHDAAGNRVRYQGLPDGANCALQNNDLTKL
ncbi:MAG: hypothetical protein SFV19_11465 [Rhodospirillaceae bacterium]|nr:hypothetical protein [Rhodospirillaceae bacterium]